MLTIIHKMSKAIINVDLLMYTLSIGSQCRKPKMASCIHISDADYPPPAFDAN